MDALARDALGPQDGGGILEAGYRELPPPPELRGSLACLWVRVAPAAGGPRLRVLPDACTDLIWQAGRGLFVAGPDTGPAVSESAPLALLVGARFLPGAGGPAFGVPLSELRDQRVDAADVLPRLGGRLLEEPLDLAGIAALARRLVMAAEPDLAVRAAISLLADPRASVETVADEVGLSERQLRRRFHAAVGYGPRTLQRVLRFRRFLSRLDAGGDGADLATLAIESGYADQAHLTRECTRLAGLPPAALTRTLEPDEPAVTVGIAGVDDGDPVGRA
jgi:AraC-like DNA-binding protein